MTAHSAAIRRCFVFAFCLCVGCNGTSGSTMPQTYPATGSVKFKDGKPATGGAVQFAPLRDTTFTVTGDLKEDGSFVLSTVKGRERVTGAPEGEYRVTVLLPFSGQKANPAIVLPKTYRIEPKENSFHFEIPAGKP